MKFSYQDHQSGSRFGKQRKFFVNSNQTQILKVQMLVEEAFPKLSKLILNKCPKLTVMPQILSIQHLELQECSATLVHSFRNLTSLETLMIAKVRDLVHFPGAFPLNNLLLRSLGSNLVPFIRCHMILEILML